MNFYIVHERFEKFSSAIFVGLFTGFLTIAFVLWRRFYTRLPKDLLTYKFEPTFYYLFLFSTTVLCITTIIMIIRSWKDYHPVKLQERSRLVITIAWYYGHLSIKVSEFLLARPRLLDIMDFVTFFILRSVRFLLAYICRYIIVYNRTRVIEIKGFWGHIFGERKVYIGERIVNRIVRVGMFIDYYLRSVDYQEYLRRNLFTLLIFVYPIRIFCTLVFFVEVIVYNRIDFFYYVAILLLIPYSFYIWTEFYKIFADTEDKFLSAILNLDKSDPEKFKVSQEGGVEIDVVIYPQELQDEDEHNPYGSLINHHMDCLCISRSMETFKILRNKGICLYLDTLIITMLTIGMIYWIIIMPLAG